MAKQPNSKPQGRPTNNPGDVEIHSNNTLPKYQTPPPPPPKKSE